MGDYAVPLLVSRGYAVLLPNPRGSSGRGQEFAAAVVGDMGGADTHDYLSGIDAMIERGIADPARIGTMGVSYGGFMSAWLVTQDQRFKAAVAGSPVTEWYSFTFTTNIPRWGLWFLDDADPEEIGEQGQDADPAHGGREGPVHAGRPGQRVLPGTDQSWGRLGTGDLPRGRTRRQPVPGHH
jgi:dipeptidyl aminopeptidase/acylaminoacyl peptidase